MELVISLKAHFLSLGTHPHRYNYKGKYHYSTLHFNHFSDFVTKLFLRNRPLNSFLPVK